MLPRIGSKAHRSLGRREHQPFQISAIDPIAFNHRAIMLSLWSVAIAAIVMVHSNREAAFADRSVVSLDR